MINSQSSRSAQHPIKLEQVSSNVVNNIQLRNLKSVPVSRQGQSQSVTNLTRSVSSVSALGSRPQPLKVVGRGGNGGGFDVILFCKIFRKLA